MKKERVRCAVTHADYFFNCYLHYRDKVGYGKSSITQDKGIEQECTYDMKLREVTGYVTHTLMVWYKGQENQWKISHDFNGWCSNVNSL